MGETLPPLRIRENDGSPNLIPVYEIVLSSNLTLESKGPGVVSISATTGAGGTSQAPITFPLIVGSGGTGQTTLTSRGVLVGSGINAVQALAAMNSGSLLVGSSTALEPQILTLSAGSQGFMLTTNSSTQTGLAWAATGGAGSSVVFSATDNKYVVLDLAADLTNEFRLVQSGNSISITTATGLVTINATTGDLSVKQNSIAIPLIVGSGGTGQTTFTNRGILVGSGVNAVQALAALNSGGLLVGSSTLLAPQILTVSAGSQGFMLTTNSSTATGLAWTATGGAGSSVVYSATDNKYVVLDLAADLTSEFRLVQSGNSITMTTAAGIITINATTGDLTVKQDLVAFPIIVGSGGTGQTTLTSRGVLIGSGVNAVQALAALNSGELLVGSSTLLAPQILPLSAGSQGYVLASNSASRFGISWVSTGNLGAASTVIYAATGNSYVVTNLAGDLTGEFRLVQSGNSITIDTTGELIVINAVTGIIQTVRFPMALLTVNPRNANAFYQVSTGTSMDRSYVAFSDLVVGLVTYWCLVPGNVNTTENWNIFFQHGAETTSGGNVSLSFRARVDSANSVMDTSPTLLISTATYAADSANRFALDSASGAVMDSTLGLVANNYLRVVVERSGALAGDTVGGQWNIYGMYLQCDVNS